MIIMNEIKYCPVCGSDDILKQEYDVDSDLKLIDDDAEEKGIDYFCNDCRSNGDIEIVVKGVKK